MIDDERAREQERERGRIKCHERTSETKDSSAALLKCRDVIMNMIIQMKCGSFRLRKESRKDFAD